MSEVAFEKPVEDSVAKVDNEIAVGEDLAFQRRWWRFERVVWIIFLLLIVCDLIGLFGRGPLAHARVDTSAMEVRYDRVARYGTPSMIDVAFKQPVTDQGKYRLFVSESVVEELGAQRVIPSPETTVIGGGGLTYTFPATSGPASAHFALQPAAPGIFHFQIAVPGSAPIDERVVVMP